MSPISDSLKADAWASQSQLPLVLIEIDHADLSVPIRVVNNKVNITSNSVEYTGYPFDITLPDSPEDAIPGARLRISNVSREIGQAIRSILTPPSVSIKVVRPDTPDIVEMEYNNMIMTQISYDALTVEGALEFEDLEREPYPGYTFSPAYFRGMVQ